MKEFARALRLEVLFALWCEPNYELFHSGGEFVGIGTPREIFVKQHILTGA